MNDLTGMRFGRLAVLRLDAVRLRHSHRVWVCLCDCGQTKKVLSGNLTNGDTQSCGCLRKQIAHDRGVKRRKIGSRFRYWLGPAYDTGQDVDE